MKKKFELSSESAEPSVLLNAQTALKSKSNSSFASIAKLWSGIETKNFKMILLCAGLFATGLCNAQTGINTLTPNPSAALDIVSTNKGVLLPRMTTTQKTAIANPATGLLVYDTTLMGIYQNIGTTTAPQWVPLSGKDSQSTFFYMPSIAIDASTLVAGSTVDLYAEYKKQFLTPTTASAGAPASIPYFVNATDLYYYVTLYDNTVLKINSLSATGVLNYDVIKESGFASIMNVVFVVK
jgi:hypothetical protein